MHVFTPVTCLRDSPLTPSVYNPSVHGTRHYASGTGVKMPLAPWKKSGLTTVELDGEGLPRVVTDGVVVVEEGVVIVHKE